jgi:hypothetical protein
MLKLLAIAAMAMLSGNLVARAAEPWVPSPDYGKTLSIIGGCHDCHTADYGEKNGDINPATALEGNPVGYRGPWGTTYAVNLRLLASQMKEDDWVKFLQTFTAQPPMPYYNVQKMDDVQMRSLYQYIASLGDPGDSAPDDVPPGKEPKTAYLNFAPTRPKP